MATSLKRTGQNLLKSLGLYQRVKSSAAYDLYWRFADPGLIDEREREAGFYRRTLAGLQPGALIFDIGANRGHKTHLFLRLGARVVAVEPDKENQRVLRESFLSYRLSKKPVTIVGQAVSDRAGVAAMWVEQPGSAKNTLDAKWVQTLQSDATRFGHSMQFDRKIEVETVTLDDLVNTYGRPFYVKIDVEGHEPAVLRGLSAPVPYLSFEVNLPEFISEAADCVRLLKHLNTASTFNYTADCGKMTLPDWVDDETILRKLSSCGQPSVEVFCRS